MQEINSSRKTNNSDYGLKILILQTVAVAIVLLTAFGIRLFGGEIYSNLSRLYHEKFDDITLSEEVLEPKDNIASEKTESSEISNTESGKSEIEEEHDGHEEQNVRNLDHTGGKIIIACGKRQLYHQIRRCAQSGRHDAADAVDADDTHHDRKGADRSQHLAFREGGNEQTDCHKCRAQKQNPQEISEKNAVSWL